MVRESNNKNSGVKPQDSHRCGMRCLGPLSFHHEAVGDAVCLRHGGLVAERTESTFQNGLVFSSRPIKIQEKVRLVVQKEKFGWHGTLRLGFTNVPPMNRSLPLPPMAIPNLTKTPGHWAALVHEDFCEVGSEFQFWVSAGGNVYISNNSMQQKLLEGVDLSQPLWAMIDVYGQTCSVFLLGSEKTRMLTRRSCPVPEPLVSQIVDNHHNLFLGGNTDDNMSCLDIESQADIDDCVVCMGRAARVTLPCGHRCLCSHCSSRVIQQFGNCPLCRHDVREAVCVRSLQ